MEGKHHLQSVGERGTDGTSCVESPAVEILRRACSSLLPWCQLPRVSGHDHGGAGPSRYNHRPHLLDTQNVHGSLAQDYRHLPRMSSEQKPDTASTRLEAPRHLPQHVGEESPCVTPEVSPCRACGVVSEREIAYKVIYRGITER